MLSEEKVVQFPRQAITTIMTILMAGEWKERAGELAEAVSAVVTYYIKVVWPAKGPVDHAMPLSDSSIISALQTLKAAPEGAEAALDPTIWGPIINYLLQFLLDRIINGKK